MAKIRKPPTEPVEIVADNSPTEPIEIEIDETTETTPVEIEIRTAEPAPKAAEAPTEEESPVKKGLDAIKRAEELQRDLAEANRRAEEAQRLAREREQELHRERGDRADAEYNSILTAIAAEQASLEQAEAAYTAAATNGDWATASKAQVAMARASARIDRLEDNKVAFDGKREEAKRAPVRPNDFETQIAALPQEAKTWLRGHQDFWTDPAKNRQLSSAYAYIVNIKRIPEYSKEFFDQLETELGLRAVPAAPASPEPRRSMPVTAPVSRDVPTPSGQRTNARITLTPEERDIARRSFTAADMTDEQKEKLYAMNKAKLLRMRANGQYRHTTEQTG